MPHPNDRTTVAEEPIPTVDGRRRRLPPMSVLPTLCTLGNLVAGFTAIHYAARPADFAGPWGWSGLTMAGLLIFVGILLDAVDGWIARLMRSMSELGGQLDSLADAVTFCVAPAFMTVVLVGRYVGDETAPFVIGPEADDALGKVVWAVAVVYLCCGALRLARFNVETGPGGIERSSAFRGLPSPGAAGAIASVVVLHQHLVAGRFALEVPLAFVRGVALGLPFLTLLCGLAMVSTIPYAHVTNRYLYGSRSFGYVVRLVVVLALAVWFTHETLAVLFMIYILTGPFELLRRKLSRDKPGQSPIS